MTSLVLQTHAKAIFVVATPLATFFIMYEYRKLNSAEREEVLRYRREQGYPLHAPPHPRKSEGGFFMITAANFEHKHILSLSSRRSEFELSIFRMFERAEIGLKGWVIMPNHYHLLICTRSFERIPMLFKLLHGKTSHDWNREDNSLGRKVWFKYSDRKIRTEDHFYAALNYVHFNPVKHGYVGTPDEWPWSSFHLMLRIMARSGLRISGIPFRF